MSVFERYRFLKLQEEEDADEMCLVLTVLAKRKKKTQTQVVGTRFANKKNHLWIVPSPVAGALTRRGQTSFIFSDDRRTLFRNVVLRGTCTTKHVFAMGMSRP